MVRSQRGFSLIEVLVAFSVTALSLGVIYQIQAKGATAAVLANEYAQALAIAESKLAGASVNGAVYSLPAQGREQDKYDWEIRIEDYLNESQDAASASLYALVSVDVIVRWQSRGKLHYVDLHTLKPVIPR